MPSRGFRGLPSGPRCSLARGCPPFSASTFTWPFSSCFHVFSGHFSLDPGLTLIQDGLTCRSSPQVHLQRPLFQIRSRSEILGGHVKFGGGGGGTDTIQSTTETFSSGRFLRESRKRHISNNSVSSSFLKVFRKGGVAFCVQGNLDDAAYTPSRGRPL